MRAAAVVNATGVWADDVRSLDGEPIRHELRPAKGIHVTVRRSKLPCDVAAIIPVPSDRRSIFVVPWGEFTYLGTTDTDYSGSLDDPGVVRSRRRLRARGHQCRRHRASQPLRRDGHLGRPATPARRHAAPQGAERADRRPLPPPPGHRLGRRSRHRSPAASSRRTARWPRTPSRPLAKVLGRQVPSSATRHLKLRGADGAAALSRPGAARALGVEDAALAAWFRATGAKRQQLPP